MGSRRYTAPWDIQAFGLGGPTLNPGPPLGSKNLNLKLTISPPPRQKALLAPGKDGPKDCEDPSNKDLWPTYLNMNCQLKQSRFCVFFVR